jgi:hypothetical protein
MKAFLTTIIVPNDWTKHDILCACNIGIRKYAEECEVKEERAGKASLLRSAILHSVTIAEEFDLKRQDV